MTLLKNVPLKKYSNYKIGGIADYFFEFNSKDDLLSALSEWKKIEPGNLNIFILGKGTNILFSDEGYRGLVLKDNIDFIEFDGNLVKAGSGVLISDLIDYCVQNSLSGLEWAGGLPGTVGGAVRGNAGAFGGETKDNLEEAESIDLKTLKVWTRKKNDCQFGYRQSIFKNGDGKNEVILYAKFKFTKGDKQEIKSKTQERIDYRIDRHPLDLPNIGSIFKNIPVENIPKDVLDKFKSSVKQDPFPVLPVAKLIAATGLIGKTIGGAQISTKHPNFIVNINNAKSEDVLALIQIVKKEIKDKFDISLEEEIMIV